MKIYPTPLFDHDAEEWEVGISRMSITYCQAVDTEQETPDPTCDQQEITISTCTSDACIGSEDIREGKEEDGFYFTIATERWAIDSPNDLLYLLNDFLGRLRMNNDKLREQ